MASAIKIKYYKKENKIILEPSDGLISDSLFRALIIQGVKIAQNQSQIIFQDNSKYNPLNKDLIRKTNLIVLEHKFFEKRLFKSPKFNDMKDISKIKDTFDNVIYLQSIELRVDNFVYGCKENENSYYFIYVDSDNSTIRLSTIGLSVDSKIVDKFSYDDIDYIQFNSYKELDTFLNNN